MAYNSLLRVVLSAAFLLMASSANALETITFDDDSLTHGQTVSTVTGNNGSGPISVYGNHPADGGAANWARAFDSNTPTCGDDDLGTPNETCPGGGPGTGSEGEVGQPAENCMELDNVLIMQQIGCSEGVCTAQCLPDDGTDPAADDADNPDATFVFDFTTLSTAVTIHSMDFLDVEAVEANATITLLDGDMNEILAQAGDPVGDNGYGTIDVGSVGNVSFMVVSLGGSGAIDNIVFSFCGDGIKDPTEDCDDGNDVDDDECRNDCTAPVCGDGIVDAGESCDDGNQNNDDDCRNDCTRCGDGNTDAGEQCDDGNDVDDDECRNDCTAPICGDGIVDAGEACDDGNDIDDDGCRNNCTVPACGDGIVDAGEDCDDGNDVNDDDCRNDCTAPECGDGIVDDGEDCDDGNDVNDDDCRNDCTAPECGDGIVDDGEDCDDGNNNDDDDCRNNCTIPRCGDGIVDNGEECDDGNEVDDDDCHNDCTTNDVLECRFTGGGNREDDVTGNRYTFGGQAGASTAEQPQPRGEWTHHQQMGPSGRFIFHAGTASAPEDTEVDLITCSDPGWCVQARHAPAKQLDFEGVGTFRNMKANPPAEFANVVRNETRHWFEVHIEDLGEPGSEHGEVDTADCPPGGNDGEVAFCGCQDYYRITIYEAFDNETEEPNKSDVIYSESGYLEGGNFQIHPPVAGDQHP